MIEAVTDMQPDGVLGELTQTENISIPWEQSFPTLLGPSVPPCGGWPLCTKQR